MNTLSDLSGRQRYKVTTIGAICDKYGGDVQTGPFGSQLHASDYSEEGTPVVMPQDMFDSRIVCDRIARVATEHVRKLSRHVLREGDLVFSRRGDVARFAVVTSDESGWLCGTGSIRIRMNCPNVFIGYARRYLQQKKVGAWLLHESKGVTMPNLNTKIIRGLPFVFPPFHEQLRIAAILDQADALRAKRREVLMQMDNLRKSIFFEMFQNALCSKKRFELGDLVDGFRYGTSNKSGPTGYPALRIPNITNGSLDLTELKMVEVEDAEFRRLRLLDGDLLFVRTNGNPDNVGRCTVFSALAVSDTAFDTSEFIYASYLIRARLKKGSVLPVVLQEYLSGGEGRQALRARCKTSAGQFNINTEGLGTLLIPNFPMSVQEAFVQRKQSIERLTALHRAALDELDILFTSLQHRAFHGQL